MEPSFDKRESINKMIDDSVVLTTMRFNEPEKFKTITVDELNKYFKAHDQVNIIKRVFPLYEGIYPNDEDILQYVKDFDFLDSQKRKELFILIRFSYLKESILKQLNDNIVREYKEVKFKSTLKDTLLSLGFVDLLKSKNYSFTEKEFLKVCENGHLSIVKYIYEFGEIDIHDKKELAFRNACRSGNFELVQYILNIGIDLLSLPSTEYEDIFSNACRSGNLKLVQFLWKLGIKIGRRFDLYNNNEFVFLSACESGSVEVVQYILNLGIENGRIFDIHINNEYPFFHACTSGNIELIEYLLKLGGKIDDSSKTSLFQCICYLGKIEAVKYLWALDNKKFFLHIPGYYNCTFGSACYSGNIELIKYIWQLGVESGEPFDLSTMDISEYDEDVQMVLNNLE